MLSKTTLKQCKICFKETEGSVACQAYRDTCTNWEGYSVDGGRLDGGWTLGFRDDTDNRAGGCNYTWRLVC